MIFFSKGNSRDAMNEQAQILIVDDDVGTRRTMSLILEKKGYAIETAGTGQAALDMANRQTFDAALIDVRLSDIEGIELLTPFRHLHPDIVLILATGYASTETAIRALNDGADAYVTKPLDMDVVLSKVQDLLERQRLRRDNQRLHRLAQQELQERRQAENRLQQLYQTSRALASSLDEESAVRILLQAIHQTLGCEHVLLSMVDEQQGMIGIRHGIWEGQFDVFPAWFEMSRYPLDDPDIIADVARSGCIEIIDKWDDRFNRQIWEQFGHERLLRIFMPIKMKNRALGVIEVAYDKAAQGRIEQAQVETLAAFADQIAAALENARLFAETERRAARLRALYEIDRAILGAHSPAGIAQAALAHLRRLIPTTGGYVALFDLQTGQVIILALDQDRPIGLEIGDRTLLIPGADYERLAQNEIAIWENLPAEPNLPPALQALCDAGIWMRVGAPLHAGGQLIGILALVSDRPMIWTGEQNEILREVSSQVAVALHNARLEAARRAEQDRLRTLIDNLPDGVLLLDAEQRIALANPAAVEMLGWLEVAPDAPLTRLGPHSLDDLLCAGRTAVPLGLQPAVHSLEAAAYPVPAADGHADTLLLLRDVTELRQAQSQARQRDRLAAVGRLAGGVAHDFNNILTAIIGYTDYVRDSIRADNPLDWPPGVELRADLEQVSLAASRAAALTRQLLIFSRKDRSEPQVFDLNTLVSGMSKMLAPLLGEDIALSLRLDETPAWVEADPGQIEQVVMNLVVNARDAMPRGGPLTIETAQITLQTPRTLSHANLPAGAYVRMTVQDAGIGLSPNVMEHLFEPFFTTKSPDKGTGLGLATVYGIVQQSGGYIDVRSELGRGARFDIYLPGADMPVQSPTEAQLAESKQDNVHLSQQVHPTETILLVEDEDSVRELARRVLERRGYTVLAARGADEALLLSERYQAEIDLLLTDVVMPEMNGPALVQQIVVRRPRIKVLFMSGYTGDVAERYGLPSDGMQSEGLINLLHKPFEGKELALRVHQTLSEPTSILQADISSIDTAQPSTLRLPDIAVRTPAAYELGTSTQMLQDLRPGEQLCFIYQQESEANQVTTLFVRHGLDQRHKVLCLADVSTAQRIIHSLQQKGTEVEPVLAAGQLVVWDEDTAAWGKWETPESMIAWLRNQIDQTIVEGYTALRVINDMNWLGSLWAEPEQISKFETLLNDLLTAGPLLAICQYNRQQFDARILLDVLRLHPLVLIGEHIYDNFYYTGAPGPSSGQAEITLDRWIANLEIRRQSEAAIHQSEQKLRSFIEHSEDAIVLTDEQGRIVEWNQGAEHVFGLSRSQAIGRYLWDVQYQVALEALQTSANYENLARMIQDALKNGWSPFLNALRENEIRRPDGTRRNVQTLAFAIQTEQGFILASNSRDVTERKRAEESLLKSEARYRALIEHIPAIIYETPFGESIPSFYAGPQIERLLGFGQKEWTESSKLWLKQLHPDDRMRVLSALAQCYEGGSSFSAEYRLISRDGHPVWFYDEAVVVHDEQGVPLFLHGIMLEINQRKQAEEHLHRYATHLKLLNELGQQIAAELELDRLLSQAVYLVREGFGYHHVGLYILDPDSGALRLRACAGLYVDLFPVGHHLAIGQGMVGWVGLHGERLLANNVLEEPRYLNPYADIIPTRSEVDVPIRTGGELVGVLDVQSPDLDAFDQDDILVLETLADQIAIAIRNAHLYAALVKERASLARRVDERTAELSLANAELARAARLKDEFLANMSHELRTPLNAILGLSEAVREGAYGSLNDQQAESLDNINEAGTHLLALVNDILDVAKAEAGKLELQMGLLSVYELCQASLGLVRQIAHQKHIKISLDVDERVTVIQGDQRRLKQALVNLLGNGVKFTPEGGQVGLVVAGDPVNEIVHLTVWDSGIGISEKDVGQLFQPFVQIDGGLSRQYAGTGLGLVLARRLAELHGGGITVQSQIGQGSRFTISLPWILAVDFSADSEIMPDDEVRSGFPILELLDGRGLSILLVEDNAINVNMVRDYLLSKGYQVMVACDGGEAIELAHRQKPDLILMDIQMPQVDGLTAIRQLRQEGLTEVPIIALTALAMPGDRERCIEAGADDYLSKPVGMRRLLSVIEHHIDPNNAAMLD